MNFQFILNKFEITKQRGEDKYQAKCPAHNDKTASLSIEEGEEEILIHCHAGCRNEEVLKALGLEMKDLFKKNWNKEEKQTGNNGKLYTMEQIKGWPWTEAVYDYRDKKNLPYMLVLRKTGKDFIQYSYIGNGKYKPGLNKQNPVIYKLPEVIKSIEKELVIYITEGEKDADNLWKLGLPATTAPGGAGASWKKCYNQHFKGAKIVLFPDNDKPGQEHMTKVAKNLYSVAKEIRIVNLPGLPEKGDVSDWIKAGGTKEQLFELIKQAGKYEQEIKAVSGEFNNETGLVFYTDTWNGEQFALRYGKDVKYCDEWKSWFIWSGQKWEDDKTRKIQTLAKETIKNFYKIAGDTDDDQKRKELINHIRNSEGMTRRKFMLEAASSEPGIPITPKIFDQDKWLLNLKNGTLNLKTIEFKEHCREDYITKLLDISYNSGAKCETWIKFLNKIFGGNEETIRFAQKAIGYSLTGLTIEQCIFILHGNGSNGKSTFINTIKEILGEYAQQTPSETLMEKKNSGGVTNDLARLRGARFVASVETEQGRNFAEALVKQISGDDTISARFLHKEFFEFKPECKIWIATNHKPKIKNTDHAIWRRIKLIPFNVTIPDEEKDLNLMDKLREEKEGILAWMIEGCRLWQVEGLQTPEEVKRATQAYREEMDVIGAFLDECCMINDRCRTTAKELYDSYVKWCEENGEYVISQRVFGIKLSERGFDREKCHAGLNRNKFLYLGIGILDIAPDAPDAPQDSIFHYTRARAFQNSNSLGASGASGAEEKCQDCSWKKNDSCKVKDPASCKCFSPIEIIEEEITEAPF